MKKTKIIGTIGPVSEKYEVLKQLIKNGLNCIRINMSHAYYEECVNRINIVRKLNEELDSNVGILIDTKGPELRTGDFKNGQITLLKDSIVYVTNEEILGDENKFTIRYPNLIKDVKKGSAILLNNGLIKLSVIEIMNDEIKCIVENTGIIKNKRSVNLPGIKLSIPFLSTKDREDINFAIKNDVDFIALSFVSSMEDVIEVKEILKEQNNSHIQLIAKIENQMAVDNIEQILKVSDGIMIARGDLGVEVPMEKLPSIQKKLVELAKIHGKICIVATEMLASMEFSPRPTRAEVSDVANAIIEGTDAIMLSGETATGNFPVETVNIMSKIALETEKNYKKEKVEINEEDQNITKVIASSVVDASLKLNCKNIVAATTSGYTARAISKYRPNCMIIATSQNEETVRSLCLNYGIYSVLVPNFSNTDDIVDNAIEVSKKICLLNKGDNIIITGGFPNKHVKHTNFMKIEQI